MPSASPLLATLALPDESISPAIISSSHDVQLTRYEVNQAGHRLALVLSLERGDVVALSLGNGMSFVIAFFATVTCGAVSAPLNPTYTAVENEFYLRDSKARMVLVPSGIADSAPIRVAASKLGLACFSVAFDPKTKNISVDGSSTPRTVIRPLAVAHASDVALILHTSGTTGRPKAVPLTHGNLACSARNVGYTLDGFERGYLIQVLFHIHGIVAGLLAPLLAGGSASVVIADSFEPGLAWHEFHRYRCDWLTGTPSALQLLLHAPKPAGLRLGFIRSCSSPLLPTTFKALQDTFKCPIVEAYAMTENAHQMTTNSLSDPRPGTVGKPVGSVKLETFTEEEDAQVVPAGQLGEICISGPSVTSGYQENDAANEKAFFEYHGERWFRTGDRGVLDVDGTLSIFGRISEIINRGGEKISPPEIDEALMLCSADMKEAACFAVPDPFWGQEVEAAVVMAPGSELKDEQILHLLTARLAEFKIPKRIHFCAGKIPKGPTGKIQRNVLSNQFATTGRGEATDHPVGKTKQTVITREDLASVMRVEAALLKDEVTLLELGCDSMTYARLSAFARRSHLRLDVQDLIRNPTVKEVFALLQQSQSDVQMMEPQQSADRAVDETPRPFSLLPSSLTTAQVRHLAVLQTTLQREEDVEDAFPLTSWQKLRLEPCISETFKDTQIDFVIAGYQLKPDVDLTRLREAFDQATKSEPTMRSYLIQSQEGDHGWILAQQNRASATMQWVQLDAVSSKLEAQKAIHQYASTLRHRPGVRTFHMVAIDFADQVALRTAIFFVTSHIYDDNTTRILCQETIASYYLGLQQTSTRPSAVHWGNHVKESLEQAGSQDWRAKELYWREQNEVHQPYPALSKTIVPVSYFKPHDDRSDNVWDGGEEIVELSVKLGITIPTVVQSAVSLALALYLTQDGSPLAGSVTFARTISTRGTDKDQMRGYGVGHLPVHTRTCEAMKSLWLHFQVAADRLKEADMNASVMPFKDTGLDVLHFIWREGDYARTKWSCTFPDGPVWYSYTSTSLMCITAWRLGNGRIYIGRSLNDDYEKERLASGFKIRFDVLLKKVLTFLCRERDNLTSLTLEQLASDIL